MHNPYKPKYFVVGTFWVLDTPYTFTGVINELIEDNQEGLEKLTGRIYDVFGASVLKDIQITNDIISFNQFYDNNGDRQVIYEFWKPIFGNVWLGKCTDTSNAINASRIRLIPVESVYMVSNYMVSNASLGIDDSNKFSK